MKVILVVEGMVLTRNPALALVYLKRNPPMQIGAGHLGGAPAGFVIKRIIRAELVSPTAK